MKKAVSKSTNKANPAAGRKTDKSKRASNVLQERTDKVIVRDKDTVLKIFGPS